SRVPRRFGSRCSQTSLNREKPVARAVHTNSDFIRDLVPAHTTRADAAQPSRPRSKKVTAADDSGEIFNGSVARTGMRRKRHRTDRNRAARNMHELYTQPPKERAR